MNYPAVNHLSGVEDPAQAWNALTVGAYTEKARHDMDAFPGWTPVASPGSLAPASRTSMLWRDRRALPFKPDVVLEGGNGLRRGAEIDAADDLSVLTTHPDVAPPLTSFGDTSAATALAARMCAQIMAAEPGLWPETVRGLIVHSARWTPQMDADHGPPRKPRGRVAPTWKQEHKIDRLRSCGWGVPDAARAARSASNRATVIVQASLQPFEMRGEDVSTADWHLHDLPWPTEILSTLGDERVRLRVTLSYFIEPNPGNLGYETGRTYASHCLRFMLRPSLDTEAMFQARVSKAQRDEKPDRSVDQGWFLGPQLCCSGSVHSDVWTGAASDLATRHQIAVFPSSGWWRYRPTLGRWSESVRYALVVSIETAEVDVYAAIAAEVAAEVPV